MNKKQKRKLYRILGAILLFIAGTLLSGWNFWVGLVVLMAAYLIAGYDVIASAVSGVIRGQVFDENFLMCLATFGALATGEYQEAVFVMIFYQIGDLFEKYAVGKSRGSISELMEISPDTAFVLRDGERVEVDPEEICVGERILVSPGEKIPLDGIIREGSASVDTAALTGEALPRTLTVGDTAISGFVNLSGVLTIEVTKEFGESTVSRILELVENAADSKAKTENFITRFARIYTPTVVILAALLAVLPPLFTGQAFGGWIHRALIFLVISCPCALVISVPLGFFGGIGGASRAGILIKGSNYLEALSRVETVVMDKTGTLTEGSFSVSRIVPEGMSEEQLLEYTAVSEALSQHPIALSIQKAYGKKVDLSRIQNLEEKAGHGITAQVDGHTVTVGNEKQMRANGIQVPEGIKESGTLVFTAVDGRYAGYLTISDRIKSDAKAAITAMHEAGIRHTIMLSGDRRETAEKVAAELGIDEVQAELLPADKVGRMEEILKRGQSAAYMGDGINDAPVLARADVGIAMGAMGADAAIEAADIVIMNDQPSRVASAIHIAKRTMRIVKENIVFALGVKLIVLVMGAFGIATMWEAVFADVGVSVIAILNSMRALKRPKG